MAKAYRLDNDNGSISASRSNDGKMVAITIVSDEFNDSARFNFDYSDFMKFMSTLSKNWSK